jgi:DNA ligase-4
VAVSQLAPSLRPGEVEAKSALFHGRQFCVILNKADRAKTERLIMENGGELSGTAQSETCCVISEPTQLRLELVKKQGRNDIVKPSWLEECVRLGEVAPLLLRHVIFATPATKEKMLVIADQFGDSYTAPVTQQELREIFGQMVVDPASKFSVDNVAHLQREYFPTRPAHALFLGLVFFFDPSAPLELAAQVARHYQGAVATKLSPLVTHVVMKGNFDARYTEWEAAVSNLPRLGGDRKRYIVTSEWVLESAAAAERLVESSFSMKVQHKALKREREKLKAAKREEIRQQEKIVKSSPASLGM